MSVHTYSDLHYHFVWATKGRQKMISASWEARLYDYVETKCREYGYRFVTVNGADDHMHLLAGAGPEVAPSTMAGKLKGVSSHYVNRVILEKDTFDWQSGFSVFSVSARDLKRVADYIKNQRKHHEDNTAQKEWELPKDNETDDRAKQ